MSDFDSNPFADPEAGANPFSDPSVRQATGGQTGQTQGGMEDFNPFEDGNKTRPAAGAAGHGTIPPPQPQTQPAIMQPSEEPPPYSSTGAQKIDTTDLQRRQEELERKAEELQRKEREMRNVQYNDRQNNWPPLPKFCPVGPCFYQDFSVDIPLEFQRTVKFVYYLWMFYVIVLILNILASLAFFIVDGDGGVTFGLSIVWFVLFTPCSFLCWYRPVYKAFRSDSSFNFFIFFFIFFFQFIVCIIQALGITQISVSDSSFNFFVFFFIFFFQFLVCVVQALGVPDVSVGIISGLKEVSDNVPAGLIMIFVGIFFGLTAILGFIVLFKVDLSKGDNSCLGFIFCFAMRRGWINGLGVVGKKPAAGAIMLFIALFFSICAVLELVLLLRVHRIYRSTGASFAKAQQEFSTGVMRNEHVQNAAANAASGAAKGMASQYGSNNKY